MQKTVLYEEHLRHGAKIVEFAGYLMPIEYSGIAQEHRAVREECGLFDVSHMGEIKITGKDATRFVNYLLTNDVAAVKPNKMVYGLLLKEDGGVVDDLMAYKFSDEDYLLVVNAANKDKDFDWIMAYRDGFMVEVKDLSADYAACAAGSACGGGVAGINGLPARKSESLRFRGHPLPEARLRSGYTGEDGFEIYGFNPDILALFKRLQAIPR